MVRDTQLLTILLKSAESSLRNLLHRDLDGAERLESATDPNDWRVGRSRSGGEGLWQVPTSISRTGRSGARERLLGAQRAHPDRLHVRTGALVCRVLLDEHGAAYGVEYVDAPRAYRATDPPAEADLSRPHTVLARHEVVLSAGAFNTPQLLMLSGIGPGRTSRSTASSAAWTCRASATTCRTATRSAWSARRARTSRC